MVLFSGHNVEITNCKKAIEVQQVSDAVNATEDLEIKRFFRHKNKSQGRKALHRQRPYEWTKENIVAR